MENTSRKTPAKPHFFTPLVNQNFRNELIIPSTFFTEYLNNGERYQKAMLKTSEGKKVWEVGIREGTMVDGWNDFVEDNDLRRGDFLVFGYEGNCSFHVLLFDPTACEKEYQHFNSSQHDDDDDEACSVEEVERSDFEAFKASSKDKKDPEEIGKGENRKRKPEANATTYLRNGNPCFATTLKAYCIKNKILAIPVHFSKQIGLNCKECPTIIIKDQKQMLWNVKINQKKKGSNTILFGAGWHDFCVGNQLKEGDSVTFELTKMGYIPTFNFHYNEDPNEIEMREIKKIKTEASETSSSNGNPYFVATLAPSYVQAKILMIPTNFSKLYNLHNKTWREVIIRDLKERVWNVETKQKTGSNRFYFRNGWYDFCVGNSLKEGDTFKFELTEIGNKPTFNFHWLEGSSMTDRGKFSKAKATSFKELDRSCGAKQNITPKSKILSYKKGDAYFHGIIRSYHLTKYHLTLPRGFTRSNGLSDRNCNKMIKLRNNNGGTWQVYLGCPRNDGQGFLGRGWTDFAVKNKLKVGDKYKFELVTEDDTFILKYYGLEGSSVANREMISKAKATSLKASETRFKTKQKYTSKAKSVSYNRGESYLYGIITKWHLSHNQLRLPRLFASFNELGEECNETIKLKNKNGETWQVFLGKQECDGQVYIGNGWKKFAIENDLQVGDKFKLEVVKERGILIMNYFGLGDRAMIKPEMTSNSNPTATAVQEKTTSNPNPTTTNVPEMSFGQKSNTVIKQEWVVSNPKPTAAAAMAMPSSQCQYQYPSDAVVQEMTSNSKPTPSTPTTESSFCCTIKPYHLAPRGTLAIPRKFTMANNLENRCCDVILKNQNGESWQVGLRYKPSDGTVLFRPGWNNFARANLLQLGDECKFELVRDGATLIIFNYYGM